MKKTIIKFFDKIIVMLLGFSGIFSGCGIGIQPVEYGMPYAEFELKGVVTDKETSDPIQNIRVIRKYPQYGAILRGDTLYTDAEGNYVFYEGIYLENNTFQLKIEDIDGEENGGHFESQEIDVKFTQVDQVKKGDGHWYGGKFAKKQNVKLERKNVPHPEYGMMPTTFKP